jgi:hypothetical protein
MATKNIQVALDTTEVATEIVHPSTLSTIIETKEAIKNLHHGDEVGITLMVE